ncbi:MAG: hypothetical protein NT155_02735 [Candidatus Staskawiczbacteria bacterium]|nr:hypothetical protein [Candidatus Staskawiczbacteria bacterium]
MKSIILIEDDPQQALAIMSAVNRRFTDFAVRLVETESEFYEFIARLPAQGEKPIMVISDVMLPWAFGETPIPKPQGVEEGGFRMAGTRCWKKFRQREDLRQIPWIYFTVLDDQTIEFAQNHDEKTGYVQKGKSIEPLLMEIEDWLETDESATEALASSTTMRKALEAGLATSLSDCSPELS